MTLIRPLPYDDGYFPTATPTGPAAVSYPVPQQPAAILYSQPHMQAASTYVAPAFSSTMPGVAGAYFVGDLNVQREGREFITFTRTWATVPPFYNDFESYVYVYPSYVPTVAPGTSATITAIATSSGNHVITTAVAGVVTGDVVFINATFTNGGRVYSQGGYGKVLAAGGGTVTVANFFVGTSTTFSSVSGSIAEVTLGRLAATSLVVPSRILVEYFYTTDPATDIPLAQPFQVLNDAGYPVQAITTGTLTTPNSVAYSAMVNAKAELVAECTLARYMGNIWARTTRLIPAR